MNRLKTEKKVSQLIGRLLVETDELGEPYGGTIAGVTLQDMVPERALAKGVCAPAPEGTWRITIEFEPSEETP